MKDGEQGMGLHKCNKNTETNNYTGTKNNENNKSGERHWQV